ncbi:hypothetical protein ACSBR2_013390 [Camellia fascicularis]
MRSTFPNDGGGTIFGEHLDSVLDVVRKEAENCDCLQGKGIQERFQFMVMLLRKPLYIGIDFSCCSRGFLVISISKPALL